MFVKDRDKMSNPYREPSIDVSHQISVHFAIAVSEKKIFRNRPIRNMNCMWQPYLLMDRDEISNRYRGPPIDASYQVSVHLTKRFQRRFFQKSSNQKQELSMVAIFVNGLGRNEQSQQRTFHRCFLPNGFKGEESNFFNSFLFFTDFFSTNFQV